MKGLSEVHTWVEIIAGLAGVLAIIFGGYKALIEWRRSTDQREAELRQSRREFRHKQAIFAREFVREIFADAKARDALKMLDWFQTTYLDDEGKELVIRMDQLQPALRTTNLELNAVDAVVRTRFESLYDYLEQLENLIGLEVINFEDVETVFRYYAQRALREDIRHFGFLEMYDYQKTKKFLLRFEKQADGRGVEGRGMVPATERSVGI